MAYNSNYTGKQVEELLDSIGSKVSVNTISWDASQEEPGYISGRTHYRTESYLEGVFSLTSKNQGDIVYTDLSSNSDYILFNYNGTSSVAFTFINGTILDLSGFGPPLELMCKIIDDVCCLVLNSPTYGYTSDISVCRDSVKKLDDYYIPNTVARKAEIATINGQSLTEGGNIVIAGGEGGGGNLSAVDTIEELDDLSNDFITSQQLDARGYATLTQVQNMIITALNTPL